MHGANFANGQIITERKSTLLTKQNRSYDQLEVHSYRGKFQGTRAGNFNG